MMDVIQAIKGRRSKRVYKEDAVPEDTLRTILECASLAPSAGNRQPWTFIVVRSKEVRDRLMDAAMGQPAIGQAPITIVVCADQEVSGARYGDRGRTLYAFQDTAAAMQNMLLAAYSLGLGTCWMGAFNESAVRKALDLPDNLKPVAMTPLGYTVEEREPRVTKDLHEIVLEK